MNGCRLSGSLVLLLAVASLAPGADPTRTLDLGNGVNLELILVKAGEFTQGSPPNEAGRNDDETQRHVKITRDFYLGKYPVTRAQFERFTQETKYRTEAERGPSGGYGWNGKELEQRKEFTWHNPGFAQTDSHPVVLVTYGDAEQFTGWVSRKHRLTVQLPTEAQWEYACRARTTTRFSNGDKDEDGLAMAWCRQNAGDGTRPVGQKKPNAWGLYDLGGNVQEWCRDWYEQYAPEDQVDPEAPQAVKPARRVLRGGSWLRDLKNCRSAARWRSDPGSRNADIGFRVVAYLDKPAAGEDWEVELGDKKSLKHEQDKPAPSEDVESTRGILVMWLMLLCPFVLIGVFIAVIVLAVVFLVRRAARRDDFRPRRRGGYAPRVADDGFWLDADEFPPGAVVRFRCLVNGEPRTDRVVVEPGPRGTFVYTGGRPSQIDILDVTRQGSTQTYGSPYDDPYYDRGYTSDSSPHSHRSPPHHSSPPPTEDQTYSGSDGDYPSAY